MENENLETLEQTQVQNEPVSLEEAMRRIRQSNTQEPATNVEGQVLEPAGSTEQSNGAGLEGTTEVLQEGNQELGVADNSAGLAGADGGSANESFQDDSDSAIGFNSNDYQDIANAISRSITQQAAIAANQYFKEQGIREASINDLYHQEDDGRVVFINPDNKNRPFENRYEAQQWVDAFNAQIKTEWTTYARQMQQKFAQDTMPTIRMMQFAPQYDAMDKMHQDVFDSIVEPYQVKDSAGMVIGYSCDLNAAKAQTERICQSFASYQPAAQQAPQVSTSSPAGGPALDATTSGSTNPQNDTGEIKNLADAFKKINADKKKGKK